MCVPLENGRPTKGTCVLRKVRVVHYSLVGVVDTTQVHNQTNLGGIIGIIRQAIVPKESLILTEANQGSRRREYAQVTEVSRKYDTTEDIFIEGSEFSSTTIRRGERTVL